MVSLIDIVPQTRTVQIAAGEIELRGLALRHIADLLVRFPELRKFFAEGAPAADTIADALSLDDVADCLIAIRDLTMPNGPGPFMERIARLVGSAGGDQLGRGPDTNTPPRPNGSSHPVTASPM